MTVDPQRDRAKKPLLRELQGRTRVFVAVMLATLGLVLVIGSVRWGMSLQVKRLELRSLGTIDLSGAAQRSPIRDVLCFGLDDLGRIGFVRRSGRRFDFVRVDGDGRNLREVALPPSSAETSWDLGWSSGESWLAAGSSGEEEGSQVWRLEVPSGQVVSLRHFPGWELMKFITTRDGGFLLERYRAVDSDTYWSNVEVFDARGQLRFELVGQGNPEDGSTLFMPDALAVRANGEIVALKDRWLKSFSESGEFLSRVDLVHAWGRKPAYLTDLHAEPGNGVIVRDRRERRIVRMDSFARIVAEFEPRYADGPTFKMVSGVQATADGSLWTSDGQALLRLDANGVVTTVLGLPASSDELCKIDLLALGPDDHIHAVDARTGTVHVFAPDGRRLHMCRPEPRDFDFGGELMTYRGFSSLTVSDDGAVLLDGLFFAADGARVGFGPWPAVDSAPRVHVRRGAEGAWIVGGKELLLVAGDGSVLREIKHTPDGLFLRAPGPCAVAPDGAVALATGLEFSGPEDIDRYADLHLFTSSGEPVSTLDLPSRIDGRPFAYDGARFAFGMSEPGKPGSIVLLDTEGRELGRFTPPGETETWIPYFAAGGQELWLFDTEFRIERYALP